MRRDAPRFVGRVADLLRLGDVLARGERLVTIHGGAGMGKTRLARECAGRVVDLGVVFVSLAEARGLDDVADALLGALGDPSVAQATSADALHRAASLLAERGPTLVVLDNFEQLVRHAATVADALLSPPNVRLLVTSRELLRVEGELVHELSPLSLVADGARAAEAVELLVDRVRRVDSKFGDDPKELPACAEIARDLDGIPLALELAATRVALLGVASVRDRTHKPLDALSRGPRDAASHHRTLRGAIEGSWALLTAHEQSALAQSALFRGSFTFEAFEEVVDLPASAGGALDVLQALREKSLLIPMAGPRTRFTLYASIREFAGEKLAALEEISHPATERHTRYYLAKAETLARDEEFDGLLAERDNVVAFIERALCQPSPQDLVRALRGLLALAPLALARGPLQPLASLLDQALSCSVIADVAPRVVAEALVTRGRCRRRQGELAEAESDQRRALTMAKEHSLRSVEARVYEELTMVSWAQCNPDAAIASLSLARAIHRAAGDERHEAIALTRVAVFRRERGELEAARVAGTEALELHRGVGNSSFEAMSLAELALVAVDASDFSTARKHVERAVVLVQGSGNWAHKAFVVGSVGLLCLAEGDSDAALVHLAHALGDLRLVGYARFALGAWAYAGIAHLDLGHFEQAIADLEGASKRITEASDLRYKALFQSFLAAAHAMVGDHVRASAHSSATEGVLAPNDRFRHAVDVLTAVAAVLRTGPPSSGHPLLEAAHARVAEAERYVVTPGAATFEVRLALRQARRALARVAPGDVGVTRLVVGPLGRWFVVPSGQRVELPKQLAHRNMLIALARHRLAHPGLGLSVDALVRHGWPDERMTPAAGNARVRVTLSRLRALGLRDAIVTLDGGYGLDPELEVYLEGDASTPPRPVQATEA